jgi:hypothetical protein
MSGSLVVAIIVVVGAALSISFALKTTDSDVGTDPSSSTPSSPVESAETETVRLSIIGGCQSGGGSSTFCGCVADQMIAAGYDTVGEVQSVEPLLAAAAGTGDTSSVPAGILAARDRCAG